MGVSREEGRGRGGDGGKVKWKLSEITTRAVSRGQNEWIGKFKFVVGDVISIRVQVMEYTLYCIVLKGWSLLPNAL